MTKFLFLCRKYLNSIVLMAIWGMKHLVLLTVIILLKILKLLKKTTVLLSVVHVASSLFTWLSMWEPSLQQITLG